MRLRQLADRGDTIIEVLIVLAVFGLALSISYATANASLLSTRQAQENARATQILQTQIEKLRILSVVSTSHPNSIYNTQKFCILDDNSLSTDADECTFDGLYKVEIKRQADKDFTAVATWDDVRGDDVQDTVTMTYTQYRTEPSP